MPCRRARCCTDFSGDTRKDGSLSRFLVGGKVYAAICKGDAEEDEREMKNEPLVRGSFCEGLFIPDGNVVAVSTTDAKTCPCPIPRKLPFCIGIGLSQP